LILISTRETKKIHSGLSFVETTSGASYEANKEKVKDSDNTVGERVGAGFSAVGDKIEEKTHKAKAEAHKQAL
jgi:hypothetical protein